MAHYVKQDEAFKRFQSFLKRVKFLLTSIFLSMLSILVTLAFVGSIFASLVLSV